jgi:drug/metabolite transporter (DMT)-like permease
MASTVTSTGNLARNLLIAACAVSAGVHAGLVPEHLSEDPKLGVAFALAAVLLVALVLALVRSDQPAAPAALLLGVLILSYGMSRTVGLPLAREHTEPFDALGVVTQAVQAVGLVAALRLREPAGAIRRPREPRG